jgi:hypothetical protein
MARMGLIREIRYHSGNSSNLSWNSFVITIFLIRGYPLGMINYKYNDLGKEVQYFRLPLKMSSLKAGIHKFLTLLDSRRSLSRT